MQQRAADRVVRSLQQHALQVVHCSRLLAVIEALLHHASLQHLVQCTPALKAGCNLHMQHRNGRSAETITSGAARPSHSCTRLCLETTG